LIDYTRRAVAHLTALFDHYDAKERPESMRNLMEAMREAWAEIERDPLGGLAAPRPYPELAAPGELWRHSRSYWVAYRRVPRLAITGVFYDEADIPQRR
jgi:plasmid stabilization system protein ParE